MKLAISGVLWGRKAATLRDIQRRTTQADADKQRAYDLLQRGLQRSRRNSEGLGE
jgi:hypothetical protein